MKATCSKNAEHKRFITTAHVVKEWVVDEHGDDKLDLTILFAFSGNLNTISDWRE